MYRVVHAKIKQDAADKVLLVMTNNMSKDGSSRSFSEKLADFINRASIFTIPLEFLTTISDGILRQLCGITIDTAQTEKNKLLFVILLVVGSPRKVKQNSSICSNSALFCRSIYKYFEDGRGKENQFKQGRGRRSAISPGPFTSAPKVHEVK